MVVRADYLYVECDIIKSIFIVTQFRQLL